MIQYFLRSHNPFGGNINVKLDLWIFATKGAWKNATGIVTSELLPKSSWANLKAKVDKKDVDK